MMTSAGTKTGLRRDTGMACAVPLSEIVAKTAKKLAER
jgi:hypothetical protein